MQNASYHRFDTVLFRPDNIRGVVGESLRLEDAYFLGKILGTIAKHEQAERVIIGYDSRASSVVLESELARGLIAAGMKVMSVGICPASLLWFLCHEMNPGLSIMITGSHHAPNENGFKIMMHGKPFYGEALKRVMKIGLNGNWKLSDGGSYISGNADMAYIKRLLASVNLTNLDLRIVWYGMFGIASMLLPKFHPTLPGQHILISDNGANQEMMLQMLQAHVDSEQAHLGIGIDGQCDRLLLVDDKARLVDPDRLLPILAAHLRDSNPEEKKIIVDYFTSQVIIRYLEENGYICQRVLSSRSAFHHKMLDEDILLGVDMSGHFFFSKSDYYGVDDVFFAALKILEICNHSPMLSEHIDALPYSVISPLERINIANQNPQNYIATLRKFFVRDGIIHSGEENMIIVTKTQDKRQGWYIIYASEDTHQIIIRAEAENHEDFSALRDEMLNYLEEAKILEVKPQQTEDNQPQA